MNRSRIGRNNNIRGKAFEKLVAKTLGWTWVGSVRHSMTPGDVMDAFLGGGYWIGECKTQQPGKQNNISVKGKWIDGIERDANMTERWPVMFFTTARSPKKYAVVSDDTLCDIVLRHGFDLDTAPTWETKVRGKGRGFVMLRSRLDKYVDVERGFAWLKVYHKDGSHDLYVVFTLEKYKEWINEYGLYVESSATEHHPE